MSQNYVRLVNDSIIKFSDWKEQESFEYQRTESEVVDYLNDFISYDELDAIIENGETDTIEWDQLFTKFDITSDSEEARFARKHITAYIDAKSGDN